MATLVALGAMAAPLSPREALERVSASAEGRRLVKAGAQPVLAYTMPDSRGQAAAYVFNSPADGGFMLLSADDLAVPVLGYTDAGAFDSADVPPQFRYWMEEYARQIEFAREQGIEPQDKDVAITFPSDWKSVTPMLSTSWDQGTPYNNTTPTINNKHCPTGCVATAVAQVMYYWRYPERGTGIVSCRVSGNTLEMNLSTAPAFDWDNMLDTYSGKYTDVQADAVANLMKQCGYALNMSYGPSASGTIAEGIPGTLINNFGYNSGITIQQRIGITATDWNALCYSQLAIGPVIYAGASPEGAHCFVVDGYDGDGYFHLNWGWGGSCNGYYILNALNPTQQGTGGYYGGYNFNQGLIAGVQPTYAAPLPVETTMTLSGSVSPVRGASSVMQFNFINGNPVLLVNDCVSTITPAFGMEITKADGTGSPSYVNWSTPQESYFPSFPPGTAVPMEGVECRARFDTSLPDGRYKVRLVCRNKSGNSAGDWKYLAVTPENIDYFYVTKNGSSYSYEGVEPRTYKISDARITTPLYYDNPFILELDVENPYDVELTQSVVPYLYNSNGQAQYSGENRLVTLMPNEKTTVSYSSTFQKIEGSLLSPGTSQTFELIINNDGSGTQYGRFGNVDLNRSAGTAKVQSRKFSILNAAEEGMQENVGFVYGLNDFSNIEISVRITVSGGFIATPLTAIIYEYDPVNGQSGKQVYEKDFEDMLFLEPGSDETYTTRLHPTNLDPSKMYQISVFYLMGSRLSALSSLRFAASSGVGEVSSEGSFALDYDGAKVSASSANGIVSLEAFDAKGTKVAASAEGSLEISSLSSGFYIVRAVDGAGSSKVLKIVK